MTFMKSDSQDLFDDLFSASISDPRFVTLISYNEGSKSFDVNEDGVKSIFISDGPLRVHSCIGRNPDENSKFMGNILEYAIKMSEEGSKCNNSGVIEDFKQIISKKQTEVRKKSIVAWSQHVPGLTLENLRGHHAFLYLWGDFGTDDDPIYLVMAGICTALSSSVVYSQKSRLQISAWNWIHDVTLVAKKVLRNLPLGRLMLVILDWNSMDSHLPGEKGGQDYLKSNFFSDTNNINWKLPHTQLQYEEIICYLFPSLEENMNAIMAKQHDTSLKKLALFGSSRVEYSKAQLNKLSRVAEIVRLLEHPNNYIEHINDPIHESNWKSKLEEKKEKSTKRNEANNFNQGVFNIGNIKQTGVSSSSFVDFNINTGLFSPGNPITLDPIGSLFSADECSLFDADIVPKDTFEDRESAGKGKITFEEFLAKQKSVKAETGILPSDSKEQDNRDFSNAEVDSNDMPGSISKIRDLEAHATAAATSDEVANPLESRNKWETLENSIRIPFISMKQVSSEVFKLCSEADVDYSEAATLTESEKYFAGVPIKESGSKKIDSQSSSSCSSPLPVYSETVSHPSRFDHSSQSKSDRDHEEFEKAEMIITEVVNFLNSMDFKILFTITVDETISICTKRVAGGLPSGFQPRLLRSLFNLFEDISHYVRRMDEQFQKILYFSTTKDLCTCSRQIIRDIQRNSEVINTALQKVFDSKINLLEEHYIVINEDIRTEESKNSKVAKELVKKLYIEKTSIRFSTEEELLMAHQKWSEVARNALIEIYGQCSDELIMSTLTALNEELSSLHQKRLIEFKSDKETESENIKSLLQMISTKFGSELNRSTLANASISTEDHFQGMSQTCRSNAKINYAAQITSLSTEGKNKLQQLLDKELDLITQRTLMEFRATRIAPKVNKPATPSHSSGSMQIGSSLIVTTHHSNSTVGIRFGFDQLSAVALVEGKFRNIYGPTQNALIFTEDEVIIGEINPASKYLLIKTVLEQYNISKPIQFEEKQYSMSEILATVLSKLHFIVSSSIHANKISYAVAVPTGFPSIMIELMQNALQIAGMEGTVIREACGQLTRFMYEQPKSVTWSTAIITVVENSDDSADGLLYESLNGKFTPVKLTGSNVVPHGFMGKLFRKEEDSYGISQAIDKLLARTISRTSVHCILECSQQKEDRNTRILRRKAEKWVPHLYSKWDPTIAQGAAIFAAWKYDPEFKKSWDQRFPRFNEENQFTQTDVEYDFRLKYTGKSLSSTEIVTISQKMNNEKKEHQEALFRAKEQGKRQCLEAQDNIQNRENLANSEKEELYRKISEITRRIEGEIQSITAIRCLITELYNL